MTFLAEKIRKPQNKKVWPEKVNNALDSGKILMGVLLDLKKAFDTVDHCILLDKLYKYGIRGTLWDWFKSYLENRKQYVCYSDMYVTAIFHL